VGQRNKNTRLRQVSLRRLLDLCHILNAQNTKLILKIDIRKEYKNTIKKFRPQIQKSRVRSPALPDFLSSSGSGTGSTQPREVN